MLFGSVTLQKVVFRQGWPQVLACAICSNHRLKGYWIVVDVSFVFAVSPCRWTMEVL